MNSNQRRRWIAGAALLALAAGAALIWRDNGRSPTVGEARAAAPAASAAKPAIAVSTVTAQQQMWPTLLPADGRLAAWQEAVVGAEVGSLRISALHADVGQTVKRGQLLAQLADDGLRASLAKQQAAVAQARANLAQAQSNVARARSVAASGVLSGQKADEYVITEATSRATLASAEADQRSTEIQLGQTRIVAVDDGLVSSRTALLGNVVNSGSELFRLVRQGRIEWQAEVDAQRVGTLHAGQVARLTLPDGRQVEGRVRRVAPTLSATTNRALVYVGLPAGSGAQPGMLASGTLEGRPVAALTLPQAAIVLRDGRSDVYLLNDDATVSRRTVTTGRRVGDRVEVLSGLADGMRVVASGGAFLSDGMKVQRADAEPLASAPASATDTAPALLRTTLRTANGSPR